MNCKSIETFLRWLVGSAIITAFVGLLGYAIINIVINIGITNLLYAIFIMLWVSLGFLVYLLLFAFVIAWLAGDISFCKSDKKNNHENNTIEDK